MFNPPFDPVGTCIYCGASSYRPTELNQKLGDEHIIALSLGGALVLPEASCASCERATSGVESHCAEQLVGQTRDHLGLRARNRSGLRNSVPVRLDGEPRGTVKVPLDKHPATMLMFEFDLPAMLLGIPGNEVTTGRAQIRPLTADFALRAENIYRSTGRKINVVRRNEFVALTFARMLAKIGHAYASAKLGHGRFKPFLPGLILGTDTSFAGRLVGGAMRDEPPTTDRHTLDLGPTRAPDGREVLVAKIRLFGDLGMTAFQVVVGEP